MRRVWFAIPTAAGTSPIAGSASIGLTATGALSARGQASGAASLAISGSGALSAEAQIQGSANLVLTPSGALADASAPNGPDIPTQLGQAVATATNVATTDLVNPAANALVLAIVSSNSGGDHRASAASATFGMRVDGQGRSWKPLNNGWSDPQTLGNTESFGADFCITQIFWGITSASPGSGTCTVTMNAGVSLIKMRLVQITNVDIYAPIRQWHFTGLATAGASHSSNLPYAPLPGNMLVSVGHGREVSTTVAPAANWEELSEDTTNLAPSNVQYRTGTTDTAFGVVFGTSLSDGIAIGAIEVRGPIANAVPDPNILNDWQQDNVTDNSHTLPETGSITVGADDLILVPVAFAPSEVGEQSVTGITSTFDVQAPGWQRAMNSVAVGSSNVRVEWWWARAALSGTLTGTITITWSASFGGTKGGWIMSLPAGSYDTDNPFRQVQAVTQATTLTAGTYFNGTFDSLPLLSSRLLAVGMSTPNSNQLWVKPRVGWEYIGPPIDEGGGQTSYPIFGNEFQTFGGRFGFSPNTPDSTAGVVWGAIEVQAPAAVGGPEITSMDPASPISVSQSGVQLLGTGFGA